MAKNEHPQVTEVLLFGIFHFKDEALPISQDDVQKQLDALARDISAFLPDAVAVELDKQKHGDRIDISDGTWRNIPNEAYCLGGRIASLADLNVIHPIDKPMELNDDLISPENLALIQPRLAFLKKADAETRIREKCLFMNSEASLREDANIYLDLNGQNAKGEYLGSQHVAEWYFRNLCIFANLQDLARQYRRIVVLYGAGHVPILRDLVNTCDSMHLADIHTYLSIS